MLGGLCNIPHTCCLLGTAQWENDGVTLQKWLGTGTGLADGSSAATWDPAEAERSLNALSCPGSALHPKLKNTSCFFRRIGWG